MLYLFCGMYLPEKEGAIVPLNKINSYLLSTSHPIGKHKAVFFVSIVFEIGKPEVLQQALIQVAKQYQVIAFENTQFGNKYVIDGNIQAPNGRYYLLRTIWIIENNTNTAYLVTAYPL